VREAEATLRQVVPFVEEDVDECAPNLKPRRERTRKVAVLENPAAPSVHAIDRLGHADSQALHAAGERALVLSFRDKVNVIALYGVMRETKAEAFATFGECSSQPPKQARAAQAGDILTDTQGDVERMMTRMWGPALMRRSMRVFALSPRAISSAAPISKLRRQGPPAHYCHVSAL
jgi:hypothetical protein